MRIIEFSADMRKVFIDCGCREGDAIAAFLGDQAVGWGAYYRCLSPHPDAGEYEFIGFESPDYKHLEATRARFRGVHFSLIEKLAWVHDGVVAFDSDGESADCRLLQVSRLEHTEPWRHPNPQAVIRDLPCVDLSRFLLTEFDPADRIALKLDIEGAEYEVLRRLIDTGAVTLLSELYVEYHWWGSVSLREQIEATLRRLTCLHYRNDWP
jgi:FkbM family methyltransferase